MSPDPRRKLPWRMRAIVLPTIAFALAACAPVPDLGLRPVLLTLATVAAAETFAG